jgi:sugar phosphate permease
MPYRAPQSSQPLAAFEGRATRGRYRVVGMLVVMAVILYLDRYCISVVTPVLLDELDLDKEHLGRTTLGFFWAYALLQVPAGRLSDVFGGRATLASYVALWSLTTMALGLAYGLVSILLLRIMLGIFQAGAYPAAAATLRHWLPLSERAKANGSVSMGGRLGMVLAFALTPMVMYVVAAASGWTTDLWRPVFVVYGGLGLVWAAAFWRRHRDRPRDHPRCNPMEIELTEHDRAATSDAAAARLTLMPLIRDSNVWVLSSINFLLNVGWVFLVTWLPTYLIEVYPDELNEIVGESASQSDLKTILIGVLTAATGLAGVLGNLCGGWWGDRAVARFGLKWGRRATGLVSSVLAALVYLAALFTDNLWLFVAEMVAISFLSDLVLGSLWATYQDIGRGNTAVVLGFANMCGNLAAGGYGWLIGYLAEAQQWSLVFAISSAGFCLAAISWLMADATRFVRAS